MRPGRVLQSRGSGPAVTCLTCAAGRMGGSVSGRSLGEWRLALLKPSLEMNSESQGEIYIHWLEGHGS